MNIITAEQWAEWRLSPVTQAFLKYVLLNKQEIDRQKMDMISGPAEQINPYELSVLNGMEKAFNGILTLDLPAMTEGTHSLEELTKGYKQMLKETMGVDL